MMIYVLRHGIANPKALSDLNRELTQEGTDQTRSMAEKFKLYEPQVDKALMSPLQRARQTAAIVRVTFPNMLINVDPGLQPDADVYTFFDRIESFNVQSLLLVGHNPFLSNLISIVLDGTLESARPCECSHLYCIDMDIIAPGCGTLKYVVEP